MAKTVADFITECLKAIGVRVYGVVRDCDAEQAACYGWVNRALPSAVIGSFSGTARVQDRFALARCPATCQTSRRCWL